MSMNILYLTNHLNVGGITSYVFTLARGLRTKGHKVYVASSGGERLEDFIREDIVYLAIPIKTKSEASPKIFLSLLKLLPLIKKYRIDIIHSHTRTTQILGWLLHRTTGVRHISTCHGFFKRRLFRRIFPGWGNKVIAISEAVKDHLIFDLGVKNQAVTVIHSGIDIEKFKIQNPKSKNEIKKEFGLGNGPVVGTIARLSLEKGHSYLIEAMKIVLGKIPNAQLVIIGEGKTKENLLCLIKNLRLEKNIFLIPTVNDTCQALMAMDLFVLPSLKEGLGLSLMEAMAAALPVIGSGVGGIKTLIRHGYDGLLVKPADVQGLAASIIELLEDSGKAWSLAACGRSFISDRFRQEKMIEETERFYQQCLNQK